MSQHHRSDKTCLNCRYPVDKYFCSNCGQENLQPEESFLELVTDFYADIFHFDSKVFTSFKLLFTKPGELTRAFIEGKKVRYVHPFRLFFFLSVVLVLVLEIPFSQKSKAYRELTEKQNRFAVNFYKNLHLELLPANINLLEDAQQSEGKTIGRLKHKFNVQLFKLKELGEDGFLEKHLESQIKIMPRFYILMMPFIALFLWLVFLGTPFIFENHLIFSFHFVSFFIIIVGVYQLLGRIISYISPAALRYYPSQQIAFSIILLAALMYLNFAIKRFYTYSSKWTVLRTAIVFVLVVGLLYSAGYLVAYNCLMSI